ncbi:hypothetical protein R1flu_019767 [Riccia fluitans]|uniref:Potassium channel domain-containing protein n=1 Tax=Riccia fluitans TaxID=41844 RepID=A0ABD1ZN32_9MARC
MIMEEPLFIEGRGSKSMNYETEAHEGAIPILKQNVSLRKSEHPTLSLISPRARSFVSPVTSPKQQQPTESFFSFFLNKEHGRRTEKVYVPPSYGTPYCHQRGPCTPVPRNEAPPGNRSPGGSSISSLFRIPEDLPATGNQQAESLSGSAQDLEVGVLVEHRRGNESSGTCEICGNGLHKEGSGHEFENSKPVFLSLSNKEEEEEKVPLLQAPDFRKAKDKRHHLLKCKTAPVLSTVLVAGLGKAAAGTEGKRKVNELSATGVVWQAFVGLLVYLFVGVMIYCWKRDEFRGIETVGWIDALYFCIVTMCTIGYGDITPETPAAKILSCALVLVGFGFIDALMGGLVTFVLDRQENMILNVVVDGRHEVAKGYVLNAEKGTMRIRLKVFLAVGTVLGSIAVGAFFLHFVEDLLWIDSFYVTVISITTVGYGDFSFQTKWGRLFAALWLLLCTLGVARAFLFLAEARVQKRQRHFARKMLQSKMTATDMMDADIDNDGHVSTSEYVVYKLKAMRKINKKDIVDIVKQFEQLDSAGIGKITMTQLLEAEAEAARQSP